MQRHDCSGEGEEKGEQHQLHWVKEFYSRIEVNVVSGQGIILLCKGKFIAWRVRSLHLKNDTQG